MRSPKVAIVDYRLGNLFSVKQACEQAGMEGTITSEAKEILSSDGVILPGVGAFADAMATLSHLGLVKALKEYAASGRPLVGVCLGMQLLMEESHEFGLHQGLGLIRGDVVKLEVSQQGARRLKVPQIGWNRIFHPSSTGDWSNSPLAGLNSGEYMYFVHSFYVRPKNRSALFSATSYGPVSFCSGLRQGNIVAFQFHPERSGPMGLKIYRNIAGWFVSFMSRPQEGSLCRSH